MFKKTKVCTGVLIALGGGLMLAGLPALAQTTTSIEITGSRIKRVDAEGSVPVTVVTREEIAASGAVTVAEFMRTVTFASSGNFRPQSGSSAQSWAGMDLRGLGSRRTLVLMDGRRLPKAPMIGDAPDMNMVPMAAVERIEILTDGASAIYGSDAIGGVVNIITKKDFEGGEIMLGATRPDSKGGDRDEASAVIGVVGNKGRALIGVSATRRQMVYTNQRPWGQTLGVSTYGNNIDYYDDPVEGTGFHRKGVPGACEPNQNFYTQSNGRCSFNFNAVAADEAAISNKSLFLRADTKIANDWSVYLQGTASNVRSFGRYAPTPGAVTLSADSPNNPTNPESPHFVAGLAPQQDLTLYHRFAAAGNRDTSTDNTLRDVFAGIQGTYGKMDFDFGIRSTTSQYFELGRNYIVGSLAEAAINDGSYDIYRPYANDPAVLQGISATINRDSFFKQTEVYGTMSTSLFKMAGGSAQLFVGAEARKEEYQDKYDSLQEAGVILGSAGNSAAGDRTVKALSTELLLPVIKSVEISLAARYEKYSDYGNDFSPKVALSWKPLSSLKVRASVGKGFAAPSLPILTQKTQFSAESVADYQTCIALNGAAYEAQCRAGTITPQVDTYYAANSQLKSEKSDQYSFGAVWDITPSVSLKADYWHIKIKDTITQITAQSIVDRSDGTDPRAIPAGLGLTRNAIGMITRIDAGYANEGTLKTDGVDINVMGSYKLGRFGAMHHNLGYSKVLNYDQDGSEVVGTLGSPKERAVLGSTWTLGSFDATWNINYIGANGSGTKAVPSYVTHDLQVSYATPWKGKLTVGVLNLNDNMPKLVPYDGRNFNYYLYDSYGRQPYVRYSQSF
jgi:iron complex outermembrane receptor protein